jgi:hypothetical protein
MAGFFGKRGNPPQPVQHVIGKEHFGFLKALGIAPDGLKMSFRHRMILTNASPKDVLISIAALKCFTKISRLRSGRR